MSVYRFPQLMVICLNSLLYITSSPKPKDTQLLSIYNKEKQHLISWNQRIWGIFDFKKKKKKKMIFLCVPKLINLLIM